MTESKHDRVHGVDIEFGDYVAKTMYEAARSTYANRPEILKMISAILFPDFKQ